MRSPSGKTSFNLSEEQFGSGRYSLGALGFRAKVSMCGGPPYRKMLISDFAVFIPPDLSSQSPHPSPGVQPAGRRAQKPNPRPV